MSKLTVHLTHPIDFKTRSIQIGVYRRWWPRPYSPPVWEVCNEASWEWDLVDEKGVVRRLNRTVHGITSGSVVVVVEK
jgi:hypothetical protein